MVEEAAALYADLQTSLRRTAAMRDANRTASTGTGRAKHATEAPFQAPPPADSFSLDAVGTPECPISFVAGGDNCSVADAAQSTRLQPRENEPWRTYSELMYSGAFPRDLLDKYLGFASQYEMGMKVGMLSGTGPSCCGNQLMSFTSHGFGFGLLQHGLVERYLLMLYTAAQHGCTRGTWVCGESSSIDRDINTVDYATPAQLTVPLLLKWALLYDEPMNRTLWVTPAAPREWLQPNSNRTIHVRNGRSRYGRVSIHVTVTHAPAAAHSQQSQPLTVSMNVSVHSGQFYSVPPGGLSFRVRVPATMSPVANDARRSDGGGRVGGGDAGGGNAELPRISAVSVGGAQLPASCLAADDDAVNIPAAMLTRGGMVVALQSIIIYLK